MVNGVQSPYVQPEPHCKTASYRFVGGSITFLMNIQAPCALALNKPEEFILLRPVVDYLAGDPFYYRIRPDKVNGQQVQVCTLKTPSTTTSYRFVGGSATS